MSIDKERSMRVFFKKKVICSIFFILLIFMAVVLLRSTIEHRNIGEKKKQEVFLPSLFRARFIILHNL